MCVNQGCSSENSSIEIVGHILRTLDDNVSTLLIQELHKRGGREEYDIAISLCKSSESKERVLGVDILSQLGCGDCRFKENSVDILLSLLGDGCEEVIEASVYALGHLKESSALNYLIGLKFHRSSVIREAIAYALGVIEVYNYEVVSTLIALTTDPIAEVRSWATFGLGSQVTEDSNRVANALTERLNDDNEEVRGEAITGLARRKTPETIDLVNNWLRHEIETEEVFLESLEAAELIGSPVLYDKLMEIKRILFNCNDSDFEIQLRAAIEACRK